MVSIAKKSFSNLFVSRLTLMEETSGIFGLLLQETSKPAIVTTIKNLLIPQIKAKKQRQYC
ncbi:hypothetical protein EFY79_10830 [Hanamia caeni]|uniref:Uncharacterized protein n=1 Tax=Hanamia caeni TaxID=2294116 RepID=A0A3M9NEG2_9BACT|nr:hypothetical protein EFY79_10830 [Hanamia caeni]